MIILWCCILSQVRDSDVTDPFRDKTVRLFDDFKISGINGTRILCLLLLVLTTAYTIYVHEVN